MRNILALAALAVIGFAAIGYFRGWYTVASTPTASGGRNINIDVNSPKISQDIKASKEKLRNLVNRDKKETAITHGPDGLPTAFHSPDGGLVLPPIPPDVIDISDQDGWWPVNPRR